MKKQTLIYGMIALMGIFILTGCEKAEEEMKPVSDMTIAEYAGSDANFSILVQALTKADLVNILNGTGNFTVFAPTNAAFTSLFNQLGISGIDALTKETLTPILLYHVLGTEAKSSMISSGYYKTLSPAQGSNLSLKVDVASGVKLNKTANVTTADVDVKNGVIHVIDKVLLPPTVVDQALNNDSFSILVQAVVKANLVETLNGSGPFTIFAPTNAAFESLFTTLGISGVADLTAEQLVPILTYHVVSGNVLSTQLQAGNVETLNGAISVALSPVPTINGSTKIVATDVQASNGVIHVIDQVLLP
ncbi:MAG: fasciclin domain-containing protein [Bacteroidales bacterium]|jgi:transforming growth factor-beta-induced protein|nr:fasciclin domain-containing protein [Bacteroidales bacterium]MDX9925892.1 fasciclin domain-containing protein [Bacteroidales bacterium]HOC47450.1 fasciclin domain-containing protein [Bacteroidales bacterium]